MFDISSIQFNTENPTLVAVCFTLLYAVTLGTFVAFTYDKTTNKVDRPDHFLHALVLVTIVAAVVIQAIGDSIARGLGMIGALSIIRFRTTVRNPRNIVFMFSAIVIGIACGVLGFTIALMGTIVFCLTAFILKYSWQHKQALPIGMINVQVDSVKDAGTEIESILKEVCVEYNLIRHRVMQRKTKGDYSALEYKVKLNNKTNVEEFYLQLNSLEQHTIMNFDFREISPDNI